jgi:hypothetical protein
MDKGTRHLILVARRPDEAKFLPAHFASGRFEMICDACETRPISRGFHARTERRDLDLCVTCWEQFMHGDLPVMPVLLDGLEEALEWCEFVPSDAGNLQQKLSDDVAVDVSHMPYRMIQEELKLRGKPAKGTKIELIEALRLARQAHDVLPGAVPLLLGKRATDGQARAAPPSTKKRPVWRITSAMLTDMLKRFKERGCKVVAPSRGTVHNKTLRLDAALRSKKKDHLLPTDIAWMCHLIGVPEVPEVPGERLQLIRKTLRAQLGDVAFDDDDDDDDDDRDVEGDDDDDDDDDGDEAEAEVGAQEEPAAARAPVPVPIPAAVRAPAPVEPSALLASASVFAPPSAISTFGMPRYSPSLTGLPSMPVPFQQSTRLAVASAATTAADAVTCVSSAADKKLVPSDDVTRTLTLMGCRTEEQAVSTAAVAVSTGCSDGSAVRSSFSSLMRFDAVVPIPIAPRWPGRQINHTHIKWGKNIGRGTHGEVFKAKLLMDVATQKYERVAVKTIDLDDGELSQNMRDELQFLARAYHPNIVSFLGSCLSPQEDQLWLITELCQQLKASDFLDWDYSKKLRLLVDFSRGLAHLHKHHIFHSDVKLENTLVAKHFPNHGKVCDFGCSKRLSSSVTVGIKGCTLKYAAPEIVAMWKRDPQATGGGPKADVYSFAFVCIEVLLARRVTINPDTHRPMYAAGQLKADMALLLNNMWHENAEVRPTMADCVDRLEKFEQDAQG